MAATTGNSSYLKYHMYVTEYTLLLYLAQMTIWFLLRFCAWTILVTQLTEL